MSSPYDPQQQPQQYPQYPQSQHPQYPQQSGYDQGYGSGYPQPPGPPPRRPGVLIGASVLWILNGLFLLVVGVLVAVAGGTTAFEDAMRDQNLDVDANVLQGAGIAGAVFGVAIIALAVAVLGGATWARVLIIVVALVPTVILVATIIFPLFTLVAAVLQFLPSVGRYVAGRRQATGH